MEKEFHSKNKKKGPPEWAGFLKFTINYQTGLFTRVPFICRWRVSILIFSPVLE